MLACRSQPTRPAGGARRLPAGAVLALVPVCAGIGLGRRRFGLRRGRGSGARGEGCCDRLHRRGRGRRRLGGREAHAARRARIPARGRYRSRAPGSRTFERSRLARAGESRGRRGVADDDRADLRLGEPGRQRARTIDASCTAGSRADRCDGDCRVGCPAGFDGRRAERNSGRRQRSHRDGRRGRRCLEQRPPAPTARVQQARRATVQRQSPPPRGRRISRQLLRPPPPRLPRRLRSRRPIRPPRRLRQRRLSRTRRRTARATERSMGRRTVRATASQPFRRPARPRTYLLSRTRAATATTRASLPLPGGFREHGAGSVDGVHLLGDRDRDRSDWRTC